MARVGLVVSAWVLACGPTTVVGDGSGSEGGSGSSGGSSSTTTVGTSVGEGTSTASTSLDSSGSTDACNDESDTFPGGEFDVGPPPPECDLFTPSCADDQKCVPQGFLTRACVMIAADPLADGEPCEAGSDDPCGATSWCGLPDRDGNGTCLPLCTGTLADPICPDGTICVIDDEAIVAYCAAPCDPFDPAACPGDTSCQPTDRGFGCIEEGGHDLGDHCVQNDSCADGLYCADAHLLAGCCTGPCCHDMCCTTLCDDAHPCATGTCHPIDGVPGPTGLGFCG